MRRTVLVIPAVALLTVAAVAGPARLRAAGPQADAGQGEKSEITVNEDLMREHGLLRRLLLIYEEIDRRGYQGPGAAMDLASAADLIKRFVEDYHEKLEENYIFPRFRKADREVRLVETLLAQHQAGRKLTAEIQRIAGQSQPPQTEQARLKVLIHEFIRMYRPHAAREDTELFPEYQKLLGQEEYAKLADVFEAQETKLFGEGGFEKIRDQVIAIEKDLGINDLAEFTPKK